MIDSIIYRNYFYNFIFLNIRACYLLMYHFKLQLSSSKYMILQNYAVGIFYSLHNLLFVDENKYTTHNQLFYC